MTTEPRNVISLQSEKERREEDRSLLRRVAHEVRTHPFAYIVLIGFTLAGPLATRFIFPEAPTSLGVIGGFLFGVYAATCAVPDKFLG